MDLGMLLVASQDDEFEDEVRRIIARRCEETSVSMTQLSQTLGKNVGYVHGYLYRGVPKTLKSHDLTKIAEVLGIKEDELRAAAAAAPSPTQQPAPPAARHSGNAVPVFADSGPIDRAKATAFVPKPFASPTSADIFAIWISEPRGRLRPGDLAYVDASRPPRAGDTVIVMTGSEIEAAGELVALSGPTAKVETTPGTVVEVTRQASTLLKVRWLDFA